MIRFFLISLTKLSSLKDSRGNQNEIIEKDASGWTSIKQTAGFCTIPLSKDEEQKLAKIQRWML